VAPVGRPPIQKEVDNPRVTASVSFRSRSAETGEAALGRGAKHFPQTRAQRLLASFAILFSAGLLIVAFSDAVREFDYREMVRALRHLPLSAVAGALGGTALSFAALVGRDASALRYVGARVTTPALLIGSFCGSALGNTVGFGALTAAAVRYRIYGAVGVSADDITRLLGFVAGGFAIGLAGVGGLAGLLKAGPAAALLGWPPALIEGVSIAALAAVGGLLAFGLPGTIRIGSLTIPAPSRPMLAAQLALTSIRLLGAVLALWSLLPSTPVSFITFAAIFSAATALAAITHIPAGAGIFEAIVLWAFRGRASEESVAAALIAYRFIYYVLPLVLSAAAFSAFEVAVAVGGERVSRDERLARAAARLSPTFMSVMAFATGIMLLVSGATPTFNSRLAALSLHVPLWAVEMSHFLGSLIGVVFLFVTRGLLDRRDGAWKLALALCAASLVFSLLKGLAFGEAAFLLLFASMLLATRQQFHRPTSMFDQPFTWGWFVAVGGIIAAAFGILWLAFHDPNSARHGLWSFAFDAQAPRAFRALLGASVLAVGFGLRELLRAPKGLAPKPGAVELAHAQAILDRHTRGDAMLAYMGDKSLMFSASGRSFLMFGKRGRSWIALFDPVGPREEWSGLIDQFIRLSRTHAGRAAFYQVRPDSLPYYLDAGLSVMKLGEDAVIALTAFSLKGGAATHLRYALKRGERDGLEFELLEPERVGLFLDELGEISTQWLDARRGDEKGFSVAAFEPSYLSRQRVGLLREHGKPVAFVSVMATRAGGEANVGLMRSAGTASPVAMEFLFTRLILALKEEGLESLSLGAAPLAGIRPAPLSSGWHQLGALIWKHGDRFYNFKGLRTFKGKFNPEWQPRYFAASGALGPYVALADAAALIGGGFVSANAERDYD
jgi:phosphatidylglycerol lysyltransferase